MPTTRPQKFLKVNSVICIEINYTLWQEVPQVLLGVDENKTFFVKTGNCNDQSRYENIFSQYRHWFRIMDGIFFPIYFDHRKSSLISRMVNVTEMKVLWSFSMIHNIIIERIISIWLVW